MQATSRNVPSRRPQVQNAFHLHSVLQGINGSPGDSTALLRRVGKLRIFVSRSLLARIESRLLDEAGKQGSRGFAVISKKQISSQVSWGLIIAQPLEERLRPCSPQHMAQPTSAPSVCCSRDYWVALKNVRMVCGNSSTEVGNARQQGFPVSSKGVKGPRACGCLTPALTLAGPTQEEQTKPWRHLYELQLTWTPSVLRRQDPGGA